MSVYTNKSWTDAARCGIYTRPWSLGVFHEMLNTVGGRGACRGQHVFWTWNSALNWDNMFPENTAVTGGGAGVYFVWEGHAAAYDSI